MVGNRITPLHPEEPSSWQVGGLRRGPSTGAQRSAGRLASGRPGTAGDPRKRRRPGTTQDAFHCGRGRQHAGSCWPPRHVCRRRPMSHARSTRSAGAPRRSNGVGPERGPRYSAGMPGHVSVVRVAVVGVPAQSHRPRVVDVAGQPVGSRQGAIRFTQACYRIVAHPLSNAPS